MEKQTKTAEDQGEKQTKAIEKHGKQLVESNALVKKWLWWWRRLQNTYKAKRNFLCKNKFLISLLVKGIMKEIHWTK